MEREAPPLSAEQTARPATPVPDEPEASPVPAEAPRSTAVAPPRRTPAVAPAAKAPAASGTPQTGPRPINLASAAGTGTTNGATPPQKAPGTPAPATGASGQKVNISLTAQQKATAAVLVASTPRSPHGTRPATLYYTTSQPKKAATDSMKTTTPASSTSTATTPSSPSTSATPASRPAAATSPSTARPATASAASAPRTAATNFDYRANVDRQSREQKSVGSLLAYFVYGLIAVFVVGGGLAIYGSVVIFDKLHDQSTSISSLDDKYTGKVAALNKELATTQDKLAAAQAQIARQQDLINKEQEQLNQLLVQINDNTNALNKEHQARLQEAATLRSRIRDLEYKTSIQNLGRP